MRKPNRKLTNAILAVAAAAVLLQAVGSNAQALTLSAPVFRDTFQRYGNVSWPQLQAKGPWYVQYSGYGAVSTVGATNKQIRLRPKAAVNDGLTHAAFVTSREQFSGNIDFTTRLKTVKQLRQNSAPNAWEVAWVTWNYKHDHHFYYVILKPNGVELGKVDDRKADPNDPTLCRWETGYQNCYYNDSQIYLSTNSAHKFPVGKTYNVRVRQIGGRIQVWANGTRIVNDVDPERVYRSGSVGLYTEDADVLFDDVTVRKVVL